MPCKIQLFEQIILTDHISVFSCLPKYDCFDRLHVTDHISGLWCCMCIPLCMDSLKVTPNSNQKSTFHILALFLNVQQELVLRQLKAKCITAQFTHNHLQFHVSSHLPHDSSCSFMLTFPFQRFDTLCTFNGIFILFECNLCNSHNS